MRSFMAVAFVLMAGGAAAQYTNRSSVLDGSGTRSSGGSYTNISAAGQPGGITTSSGGGYVNQAGFLNMFFLKPGLDTDGDGVSDEADLDNDNDGLADAAEIEGAGFNPATATLVNLADTDGDGQLDGWEALAGTDPTDANAILEITSVTNVGGSAAVAWVARSNKTYRLLRSDNGQLPPTNVVATVTPTAFAAAPWYVLTNLTADAGAPSNRVFYAVQPLP